MYKSKDGVWKNKYQNDPVLQQQYGEHISQYLRDRYDYFNECKAQVGCQHCGESDYRCLDYHHVNPATKLFAISKAVKLVRYSMFDLLEEVSKCIVLCRNCHAKV